MEVYDLFSYWNGMCAAYFFMACIACGAQLRFNIFRRWQNQNILLSHFVGSIMLILAFADICYVFGSIIGSHHIILHIGDAINIIMFAIFGCVAYIIYSNKLPSPSIILKLSCPFIIIAILLFTTPSLYDSIIDIGMFVVILEYIYFGIAIRKRDKNLDDLYADPDSHSKQWIWGIVCLCLGWWCVRLIFLTESLSRWYDSAIYIYVAGMVWFIYGKIMKYGEPVSQETQKQVEEAKLENSVDPNESNPIKEALIRLLEVDKIYLNPDLTVDDVAARINTSPRNLSAHIHCDLNKSFFQLINEYRVELAKDLLKSSDRKMEDISRLCGFNSRQSFYRTFARLTGKTPSDWRSE